MQVEYFGGPESDVIEKGLDKLTVYLERAELVPAYVISMGMWARLLLHSSFSYMQKSSIHPSSYDIMPNMHLKSYNGQRRPCGVL